MVEALCSGVFRMRSDGSLRVTAFSGSYVMTRLGVILCLAGIVGLLLRTFRPQFNPFLHSLGSHSLVVMLSLLMLGVVFILAGRDKGVPH